MHVSTADVGDTGWLEAESIEDNVVTEPPKGSLLKCSPHFVQDLSVHRGGLIPESYMRLILTIPTAEQNK